MAKILIVDDSKMFLNVYKLKLEAAGFEVFTAGGGQEGLDKAKENKPDLILLDIIMPDLDGFEFLKLIKANPSLADIIVIIISGLSTQSDIDEAMKLGAQMYLPKGQVSITDTIVEIKKLFPNTTEIQS